MKNNITGAVLALVALPASAQPQFQERASQLGIQHEYTGGWEHFVGGGVATFDCNDDQFPDLYVAGGEASAVLLVNRTQSHGANVSFTSATPKALALKGVTGAYPLDIDSDGILDLFVMRVGENQILKGGAECSFVPFTDLGFDGGNGWTTAFSATWEGSNRFPTLAVGNYVDREDPDGPFGSCDTNYLMRPASGGFEKYGLEPAFCPLSMLFTDWDRNGTQDLRVSNDRHYYVHGGSEQLWSIGSDTRLYSNDDGWKDYSIWGMGIASRDITGDGLAEVFLTSMGDQKMQSRDTTKSGPSYDDATYDRGTTAHRPYTGGDGRPSTGWHVQFGDMDNDGRDDVFIAKGNVEQMPDSAMADPNNLLTQNLDGTFSEIGEQAGIATMARSRGASLADLNLDGLLDLVVVNRRAPLEIYQNVSKVSGKWLTVELVQTGSNPNAVGAFIEIETETVTHTREVTVGGGHASGATLPEHFGLGRAASVKVRVIWPDQARSDWFAVKTNGAIQITRSTSGETVVSD